MTALLTEKEKVALVSDFKGVEGSDGKADFQKKMIAIYNSIVDYFPSFSIEYICQEVNGYGMIEPLSQDFETSLQKELSPSLKEKLKASGNSLKSPGDRLKYVQEIEVYLKQHIVGQDEAIASVCNAIKLKLVGFTDVATLFFIGRTGTGKTQVARLLGDKYNDGNFFLFNVGDYANGHEINKIVGAPPGYVGHKDKSIMAEKSNKSNKWVFLFDEIEKGHEKFFNWLLPLLETGKTQDNLGEDLDFSESLFIFTSNCGVGDLRDDLMSFSEASLGSKAEDAELMKSIKKEFSPEFRNRIDKFVVFNTLSRDDALKIAELNLKEFPVKSTKELINYIVDNSFSEEYGAREIKRFIKSSIALPLADIMLEDKSPNDGTFEYEAIVEDNKIEIVNTG